MATIRRDITTLTDAEWQRYVDALNAYKAASDPDTGISLYDQHTIRHMEAMMSLTLFPGETGTQRNAAHRGPIFLPWHRQALRELELALQDPQFDPWGPLHNAAYDPDSPPPPLAIPYCRFLGMGNSWQTNTVWDRLGHNGSTTAGGRIIDGPFAHWNSIIWNNATQAFVSRTGIVRAFLTGSSMPAPPNFRARINALYDAYPWNETTIVRSYRRDLEVRHNAIHNNVGGDMASGTSPNDPIFWLHHSNIDRYWAAWQQVRGVMNYMPNGEGPPGHNRFDEITYCIQPVVIEETLDLEASDVAYDNLS